MLNGNELEPAPNENELEPPLIGNILEPPFIETGQEPAEKEDRSILILAAIFLAMILLTVCVSAGLFVNRMNKTRQTQTPEFPLVYVPTATPPGETPGNPLTIHLPIIRAKAATTPATPATTAPENVWIVTKVESLAYKSGNQRSDLATFKRTDNQVSAQGYCINRGLPTPKIGAEYALDAQGIFIPLAEPKAYPIQRFQKIQ